MTTEKIIANLLFGIEKDTKVLTLNSQNDIQIISLNCSKVKAKTDGALLDRSDQTHIIKSKISNLPFLNDSFKVIILKGIITNPKMPKKNQEAIFKNIFRMLKPNGIFYLSIENKLPPVGFAENKICLINEHSIWKNTKNILKRFLHLILIIKYYRIHLFSFRGYLKLIGKIGFKDVFYYGAPRGFKNPCVVSLERNVYSYFYKNLESPRKSIKEIPKIFFNALGINRYFCNSSILIGRKSEV